MVKTHMVPGGRQETLCGDDLTNDAWTNNPGSVTCRACLGDIAESIEMAAQLNAHQLVEITLTDVVAHMTRTLVHKGPMPTGLRGAAILMEEASEVLAETLKATAPPEAKSSYRGAVGTPEAIRAECVQVIAVAVQIYNQTLVEGVRDVT